MRNACDIFAATYAATGGIDGRVSIEVEPGLAMDTDATIGQAADLWKIVDRPNVLIKIPATKPGLPAITASIAEGISVNVTLIFSLERYRGVIDAYLSGLEQAAANGHDLSKIHSVASFFVSRVDSEVDKRLDAIGSDEAKALKGKAAIANARLAYALYEEEFSSRALRRRWRRRARNRQRPLWASTGVKDPAYSDTMYVTELVVANTVNTMPEKTMQAFADHGELHGDTVSGTEAEAQQVLDDLAAVGISYDEVVEVLETRGRARSSTPPGPSWSRPCRPRSTRPRLAPTARARAPTRRPMTTSSERYRPTEPVTRSAGSATPADRRSLRAGDLRRHR